MGSGKKRSRENTGIYSKKSICDQIEAWFNDYEIFHNVKEVRYSLLTCRWGTMVRNRHGMDLKTVLLEDGRFRFDMALTGASIVALSTKANRENYMGASSPIIAARRAEEKANRVEEVNPLDAKLAEAQRYIKETLKKKPNPPLMAEAWSVLYPDESFPFPEMLTDF